MATTQVTAILYYMYLCLFHKVKVASLLDGCMWLLPTNDVFMSLKLFSHFPFLIVFSSRALLVQVTEILLTLKKKKGRDLSARATQPQMGPSIWKIRARAYVKCVLGLCLWVFVCVWLISLSGQLQPVYKHLWPHTCQPCDQGQGCPLPPVAAKGVPVKDSDRPSLHQEPTSVAKGGVPKKKNITGVINITNTI